MATEEMVKVLKPIFWDPAPDFMKLLTVDQQRVIQARHLEVQINAAQENLKTMQMAHEMLKKVVK